MTDAEIRHYIERMATDCVLFQRIFPPQHHKDVNSYFGGQPRLPHEIEWPVVEGLDANGDRLPMALTFIAQIDLSELPRTPQFVVLPHFGTLFFFFNSLWCDATLDNESPGLGRVLYYSGETNSIPMRPEPDNLISCYGAEARTHYGWLRHTCSDLYQYPRSFARWPVKAHVTTGFNDVPPLCPHLGESEKSRVHSAWWDMLFELQAERLTEVFGRPVAINRYCKELDKLIEAEAGRRQVLFPDGFPFNWFCVEMIAGNLISEAHELRDWKRLPAELDSVADALEQEAASWVKQSRTLGRFVGLSAAERDDFRFWCESFVNASVGSTDDPRHWYYLEKSITKAYLEAPQYSLAESCAAASLIPEWYLKCQKWQHCVFLDDRASNAEDLLLDLAEHRMLGRFPKAPESPSANHVLLARFDSDVGMNWCWGDLGSMRFWIAQADLEAGRFENAIVCAG
jgi:uncharacterized protein YwqG